MKLLFEEWYKKNLEQEVIDTFCEGNFDVSYIEYILKVAYEAGTTYGYFEFPLDQDKR